ncbi:MAG: DUF805 domain-containing protein [Puniceicoccales bacterium]|jgi:uncharacterized membrane protein YhaH (DUF805 family)|nr:DUF805 domain-containing protein [Puniceicoccales bacterium]
MNWYLAVLKKYAVFSGRARRKEYWQFFLFYVLVIVALSILSGILATIVPALAIVGSLLVSLYYLATLLPLIGVSIRRLHDTGRSGWWVLISPVALFFSLQDSQPGDNQYGPNPKA